ncbi:hypothetical protein DPMN_151364 [Dreissena polymorpha]|uniref:Uncharacterized protein n=1 Tax=Dreissena polymorpha TaxID=45954 RepID=A0A9D4FL25_DREPO|nr:hypothetical protein DPMN_151364 [Dreissena polymorpha]
MLSRVFAWKTDRLMVAIFELDRYINRTIVIASVYKALHVASRVLTMFYYSKNKEDFSAFNGHVFSKDWHHYLTQLRFHENNVLARFVMIGQNMRHPDFKFGQYIIGANILTQFHKDWGIKVNVDDVPQTKRDRKGLHAQIVSFQK